MSAALSGVASGPDLLRLLAVPVFAWAAYRDVQTRRVPNRTWLPLLALAGVALAWDAWLLADAGAFQRRLFALQVAISVGLVGTLGYVFWRIGGFGGADAKAVITLSVLFPVYPVLFVLQAALPLYRADLGVFSLTILSNTVLLGLFYPVALALRNLPRGELTPAMFVGRPTPVADVPAEYGRLLETPAGFTRRGLDLDALRMYLRWRGVSFAQLRADPERYRHPLPTDRNDPGDGSIDDPAGDGPIEEGTSGTDRTAPDGGVVDTGRARRPGTGSSGPARSLDDDLEPAVRPLDEWGAGRFLAAHEAYGTTPEALREGLAVLTDPDRRTVWVTPGIPFVVPIFVGLVVALTFGDLLFAILLLFGFV